MATSSQTTVDQAIRFEFVTPDIVPRDEPAVEPPARGEHADAGELDDRWIESQLARRDRWRRPSWPLLCEVAQQYRERRIETSALPAIAATVAPTGHADQQPAARRSRSWGVVVFSVLLHMAIVGMLAALVIPETSDNDQDVLYVTPATRATDVPIGPPQLFQFSTRGTTTSPLAVTNPADCPVPPPPKVALATFIEANAGPVVDIHSLLNNLDGATTRTGDSPSGADFFGVQATGNRFVFLIDCSVTMSVGTKWMEAMRQLTTTIERLGEDGWFYVIFFSEESQPMFDTHAPEPHCLPATPENVARLRRWLLTIKTGMSTQPARSLKFALSLDPDAIYLLSDGEYDRHDPSLDLLARDRRTRAEDGRRQVVVHTLCFLNSNLSSRDKKKLRDMARQNGGTYACVPQGPRAIADEDR